MAFAITYSRASAGIEAPLVRVETHLSYGIAKFQIVGLAAAAVKESRDRVRSALMQVRLEFPIQHITVNLAPADLPKDGGRYDLPIALSILAASEQIPLNQLDNYEFIGELALSGELRPVKGALSVALQAKKAGKILILPAGNAEEAALVKESEIFIASHLLEVCSHLKDNFCLPRPAKTSQSIITQNLDFADVVGQQHAKRALEIAAAGKHSALLVGPPGTGKSMLAQRLITILPPLNETSALESAALISLSSQGFAASAWQKIPFRAPHHSASSVALVGGGRPPRPGEISLAHHGVLFLDELPEFSRQVLECLREPLESGCITISRAAFQSKFPAEFQLVAAMNPCPCGYAGQIGLNCFCSPEKIKRYQAKLSGPLLQRIDMHIPVSQLPASELLNKRTQVETSVAIQQRVMAAREVQLQRQQCPNAALTAAAVLKFCHLNAPAKQLLEKLLIKFNLSARVYHRVLQIALTIADLAAVDSINETHIAEAYSYRYLDR